MSVKNEQHFNLDKKIKEKPDDNDDETETEDVRAEAMKNVDTKFNMLVKNEHPLSLDRKIKIKKPDDDDKTKTQDDKAVVMENVDTKFNMFVNNELPLSSVSKIKAEKPYYDKAAVMRNVDAKFNLLVSKKLALNLDRKIERENLDDDDVTESQDDMAEVMKNVDTNPSTEKNRERPIFQCGNCDLIENYDCFGDHVSFNRNVRTKVDCYLTRDPFSPPNKRQFLILGSVCSVCDKDVCMKPECSMFYLKLFCSVCARKRITDFPLCIQRKINMANRI